MKQLEVHIMQQSYMLGCPEGQEERLMAAVKHVDEAMSGIRDSGKIRGRERIAVLAALNVAFDLLDLQALNTAQSQAAAAAPSQPAASAQTELDWDAPRLQSIMQRLDAATATEAAAPPATPDAAVSNASSH